MPPGRPARRRGDGRTPRAARLPSVTARPSRRFAAWPDGVRPGRSTRWAPISWRTVQTAGSPPAGLPMPCINGRSTIPDLTKLI